MNTRNFALVFGILFVVVGLAGFVPQLLQPAQGGPIAPGAHHELLLGVFPVNPLNNVVHLLSGLWGLWASRVTVRALSYARGIALVYAVLAVFACIPGLDDVFGLVPLYGNDFWLHLGLAAVAAYFGWINRVSATG
jgi:hypothetical protein